MKKLCIVVLVMLVNINWVSAKVYEVASPGGKARVVVSSNTKAGIFATVYFLDKEMVKLGPIGMEMVDRDPFGAGSKIRRVNYREADNVIVPVVQEKRKLIPDRYKEMEIVFREPFTLILRAYDDGVAYRIKSNIPDTVLVKNEIAGFHFPADDVVYFPTEESLFTHSERSYEYVKLSQIGHAQFASTPFLVDREDGVKVLITESDLEDYPGLYVYGMDGDPTAFQVKFPPYVLKTKLIRDRDVKPVETADFIAKTWGSRSFPWRVVALSATDKEILGNDIVYRLASPNRLDDTSWIKPGKISWDWWNASNNRDVPFRSGVNTATYKYQIDFASEFGLEYIILDEGWSKPSDLFQINPDVDVEGTCKYGQEKGVDIILWVLWNALDKDLERALDQFSAWGVKGIKVDFMQRDDQWMVDYYWRISKAAAEHHMLVDFHGAYKPCGLRRTYPNMITREGVKGLEHNKWSEDITPEHDCTLPFIRNFAGPMDYTPGAMRNAEKANFFAAFTRPMSQGTRAHQLGLYVVFESPLQMLADAPSAYYRERPSMEFLEKVPTVWDETIPLAGEVGKFVAVARQSGKEWYMGALTNWDARELEVKLDFLPVGKYTLTEWSDGVNADRYAEDLKVNSRTVQSGQTITIKMAPGGGYAAIISYE